MPLEIFAIIVPLGIAFIVLVVKYSGLSKAALIADKSQAISTFENDYGGEPHKNNVVIASDERAGFIELKKPGALGLVEAIGDRYLTRVLVARDIRQIDRSHGQEISIRFNDFTHKKGCYQFDDEAKAKRVGGWLAKLEETT